MLPRVHRQMDSVFQIFLPAGFGAGLPGELIEKFRIKK